MTERLNKKKYPLCAAALALAVLLAGCAPAEGTAVATAQPTAEPTEAPLPARTCKRFYFFGYLRGAWLYRRTAHHYHLCGAGCPRLLDRHAGAG